MPYPAEAPGEGSNFGSFSGYPVRTGGEDGERQCWGGRQEDWGKIMRPPGPEEEGSRVRSDVCCRRKLWGQWGQWKKFPVKPGAESWPGDYMCDLDRREDDLG